MLRKNWTDLLTALVVLGCSAGLALSLAWALSGYRVQKGLRTLQIDYVDVTGIKLHSEVRYAGAPAGRVVGLRHLTAAERAAATTPEAQRNAVRVSVELDAAVPPLPNDVKATFGSETMLSDKFIALSAGSLGVPPLPDGALLQGQGGASFDELLAGLGPVLRSVETTLLSLQPVVTKTGETLDTLKGGIADVMPRVATVADQARAAAASADAMIKRADALIATNEAGLKTVVGEMRQALVQLQSVLATTDRAVGRTDKELNARLAEMSVILQNLKVASTQVKALTETVGRQPHRLIFGGKPNQLTPEEEILRSPRPVPATRGR